MRSFVYTQFIISLTLGAGCQSYEAKPLDMKAYAIRWEARDLAGETVFEFVNKLAALDEGAAVFDPSDGLTLREADAVALCFNPQLRTARARAQVPLAGARTAGLWDDPSLEGGLLRILDSVDDPWVFEIGVPITIPLSGRLRAEKEAAWAEYGSAWRTVAVAEWQLLQDLRSRWQRWSAAQQRAEAVRDYVTRLGRVTEIADKLVKAGELKPTDARLFHIDRAQRRADLQQLDWSAKRQRIELMAMLGLVPEAPVDLLPALAAPAIELPENERRPVLLGHPRMALVRADYEVAEKTLNTEIRKQYPDLTLGPVFESDAGQSRIGFGFGLFPIPIWNRNQRGIAEATAARDGARAEAEAAYQALTSELALGEARLAAGQAFRQSLMEDVTPLIDTQLEEMRKLIELGELDVLLLQQILQRSLTTKLRIVDAALEEALATTVLQSLLEPEWVAEAEPKDAKEKKK